MAVSSLNPVEKINKIVDNYTDDHIINCMLAIHGMEWHPSNNFNWCTGTYADKNNDHVEDIIIGEITKTYTWHSNTAVQWNPTHKYDQCQRIIENMTANHIGRGAEIIININFDKGQTTIIGIFNYKDKKITTNTIGTGLSLTLAKTLLKILLIQRIQ